MGNGYRAVGLVGRGGEGRVGDQTALEKKNLRDGGTGLTTSSYS